MSGAGGRKTRAVDDLGVAIGNERQHSRPVVRVVFEVSVFDDDHMARDAGQPCTHGCTLAAILLVKEDGKGGADCILRSIRCEPEFAVTINRYTATDSSCPRQIPR